MFITFCLWMDAQQLNSDNRHNQRLPKETRAGTALLSIQKETQDRTTISMVGKYVCSMKKKMCLRRMKVMNRRLYQPVRERDGEVKPQTSDQYFPDF